MRSTGAPTTRLLAAAASVALAVGLGAVGLAAVGLATAPPAAAATGTAITQPASSVYRSFDASPGAVNTFPVSGTAAAGTDLVDVLCLSVTGGVLSAVPFASNVPVQNDGTFSAVATYPYLVGTCRLRAIPSGHGTDGDLSAFTGPVLYTRTLAPAVDALSSIRYGFAAIASQGDGIAVLLDAAQCGVSAVTTVQTPGMVMGPTSTKCSFALPEDNLAGNASSVVVDGAPAYLPFGVKNFLNGALLALGLAQPPLTTSMSVLPNGDTVVTESGPLMRCSGGNTYPPTTLSCVTLTSTGVDFERVSTLTRAGHQVRVRDAFTATDGLAHTLGLEYRTEVQPTGGGTAGFTFPAHGSAFAPAAAGQTLTGFGTGAGTVYIRSDIGAASTDPNTDTVGLTWSRSPSSIAFDSASARVFGLRYALGVPANGAAVLGFAQSESLTTAATQVLGTAAVKDMTVAPTITTPANGAVIRTQATNVRGTLSAGANGLPTSVTVNGHKAVISRTSATTATYAVTFAQSWGKHAVTVVAKDSAGNAASRAVTVTNTPALVVKAKPRLTGSKLYVPLTCAAAAGTPCVGKLVIRTKSGRVIGRTTPFSVKRGTSRTVAVTLNPRSHTVKVTLYQREPNLTYVVASSKLYTV